MKLPGQMSFAEANQVVKKNFDMLDTAAGIGGKDGLIGKADLQAALKNPNVDPEVKQACQMMLDNPALMNEVDVAAGIGNVDGLIGRCDVDAYEGRHGTGAPTGFFGDGYDPKAGGGGQNPYAGFFGDPSPFFGGMGGGQDPYTLAMNGGMGGFPGFPGAGGGGFPGFPGGGGGGGMNVDSAAAIIRQNFDLVDTAAGIGGRDGLVGRNDLEAIVNQPDASPELKQAAAFLLRNPAYFNQLEVEQNGGNLDGLIGKGDLDTHLNNIPVWLRG